MIGEADWYASAMFFLSGCFEQMRRLRGRSERMIIMDRSLWSTLAVHAAENAARLEALLAMLQPIAAQIQVPDLTIVLEASFDTCQERIGRKSGMARVLDQLTANSAFHERERVFYHWLARELHRLKFLDVNTATPDVVAASAHNLIRECYDVNAGKL
jgi:thymidylate kinase